MTERFFILFTTGVIVIFIGLIYMVFAIKTNLDEIKSTHTCPEGTQMMTLHARNGYHCIIRPIPNAK